MKRVYFIKPIGMDGPIKIGCSAKPAGRASSLETWAPFPLEVVAEIVAPDPVLELRFHAAFAHLHERREWFSAGAELLECIKSIRSGTFDINSLPPPRRIDRLIQGALPAKQGYAKYDGSKRPSSLEALRLLHELKSYAERHGIGISRVGKLINGDPRLVEELAKGREPRRATVDKIINFLASQRPEQRSAA